MRITEVMRRRGYALIGNKKVPLAESTPERKKELRESLEAAFVALGHSVAEAKIAAAGPQGEDLLDAFNLAENSDIVEAL